MTNIEERIKRVVAEQLGVNESDVKNDSNIIHDLGADSLDRVELIMAIEDEFALEIPDAAADEIDTVQQLNDYVQKRVNA